MTVPRPVQSSLIDGMDRPVGPIPRSLCNGTNADLIASIAQLYLTGSVLDVTYGNGPTAGGWWRHYRPEPFTFHDLELDGVDFCDLPHGDGEFDAVCFDPPYIPAGGTPTLPRLGREFRSRFGLVAGRTASALDDLILAGLAECTRVASQWLLVKCMEFTASTFRDMPTDVTVWLREMGWSKHDQVVLNYGRPGPGGHNIFEIQRTRRAHSYLMVFTPTTRMERKGE